MVRLLAAEVLADRRGATAIEYGLIAALISLAFVIAFTDLGLSLADIFNSIADTLAGALG
ncbi:MAG TPA: Flp family type IVb pilin [Sphingomonadaceae bacterium]|nr:Flp family type IVb pilin [Sphingomonadaceae bacterium]